MGTILHLSSLDENRPRRSDGPELELPGWEEFTAARDRFFAGLRTAAELYRTGEPNRDGRGRNDESPGDKAL